jgi:hypothetical protein
VKEADEKNWVMAGGCMNEFGNLVTGHAYTILGVVQLSEGPKLVKLRNPWGKEQYTGPFSDKSTDWTPAWKEEAGLVSADDGIFHIPVSDFKIAFTFYSVLMYQDYSIERTTVTGAGKKFIKHMESEIDQEVIVTLDYLNQRHRVKGCGAPPDVFYNFYIY